MARQKGIIQMEGTVGPLTFYKKNGVFLVKVKSEISKQKLLNDPQFERTRESMAEFGKASKAAKLLLDTMAGHIYRGSDDNVFSRLNGRFSLVIHADQSHPRGQRTVSGGNVNLLYGLDFNENAKLSAVLKAPYSATIDRVTGEAEITIPAYVPTDRVEIPTGATHYKLVAAAAEIDFDGSVFITASDPSGYLLYSSATTTPLTLTCALTPNSTLPIVLAFSIEFFQDIANTKYRLKNGSFNAAVVVKIDA